MDKHSFLGRVKEVKGKFKEEAGNITHRTLQGKGILTEVEGKVEATYGDVKSNIKKRNKKGRQTDNRH